MENVCDGFSDAAGKKHCTKKGPHLLQIETSEQKWRYFCKAVHLIRYLGVYYGSGRRSATKKRPAKRIKTNERAKANEKDVESELSN